MIMVRPATDADADAMAEVSALAAETLRETYRPKESAGEGAPKPPGKLTRLVALIDGRIVGTVKYAMDGDALRVIGLGVHPDFRKRGVATELIRYLEDLARVNGAARLSLRTVKETGNVAIFERLGFSTVSEQEDRFSESDRHVTLTDVFMEKALNPRDRTDEIRQFERHRVRVSFAGH